MRSNLCRDFQVVEWLGLRYCVWFGSGTELPSSGCCPQFKYILQMTYPDNLLYVYWLMTLCLTRTVQ